ncbi:MAG: two-component response regulator [Methanoregula sp. PtaU1.Bin051]|nr:MAG: two-component response regulator [Methanoregula sp. PtaU1.Bin051]
MERTSILIVEDDFIVAKVIEKSLRELNYHICGMVSSGQEAVKLTEQERPDLVLMDINLQGDMDGIVAADMIHSRHNIPVVFLTAFSDQKTFSRALETAPYGYIIKPFQSNTLATTIEVALNKYRLEQQQATRHHWFEGTLQSLSDGIVTIDTKGNITLINPAAEKITGWSAKEAIGKPLNKVLLFAEAGTGKRRTLSTVPVLNEGIVTIIPEGSTLVSKYGSSTTISEAIASPVRDDAGTITGAAIVIYSGEGKTAAVKSAAGGLQSSLEQPAEIQNLVLKEQQKRPVTADDWNDRGNSLMFSRRYNDAVNAYDKAIGISATNYKAWYGKGTALAKLGKNDEALAAYDNVLAIYPRNHEVLMAKGVLLRKVGRDAEADRCFELAHLYLP